MKILIGASYFLLGLAVGFGIWYKPIEKGYPYTDGKRWCTETTTAIWCDITK